MSKKKKNLRLLLPVLPSLAFLVAHVFYFAFVPGVGDEIGALPDKVVGCLILLGFGCGIFIDGILDFFDELWDLMAKRFTLTVRVSEDVYSALQQFGDKNGVKDVADVIPGICAYVCDCLRDQEEVSLDENF